MSLTSCKLFISPLSPSPGNSQQKIERRKFCQQERRKDGNRCPHTIEVPRSSFPRYYALNIKITMDVIGKVCCLLPWVALQHQVVLIKWDKESIIVRLGSLDLVKWFMKLKIRKLILAKSLIELHKMLI